MSDIVKTLTEMGFSEERAKLAVSKTSGKDVQEAMEWLLAHDEELEASAATTENEPKTAESGQPESEEQAEEAKSLKCEECGRLFKDQVEVEFHAAKSGHSQFSESTEEKKPLSEEERKEQLLKLEAKMKQKRLEREEREKQEALDREKSRIRSGKDMLEAKRKMEEQEMKKLIDQRKREKEEERLARQRVKEQIEQDRLARKAKFSDGPIELPVVQPASSPKVAAPSKNYDEAKLQIRLTNGSSLTQTFGAKEPLSAVRLYVEINRTDEPGPFNLMTTFPRKLFGPEDFDKPLDMLGLTPSAVVIVTKS